MAFYNIEITINTNPVFGDTLKIINDDNSDLFDFNFYSSLNQIPSNAVSIGQDVYFTMNSLVASFNQLYNLQGLYSINFDGTKINIIGDFPASPKDGSDNTDAKISVSYILQADPLIITDVLFLKHNANTCGKVDIQITTNVDIVEIIYNLLIGSAASGNVNLINGVDRDRLIKITVRDALDRTYGIDFHTPSFLNEGLININKFNNSITVEDTTENLDLLFSLTGNNYVVDNVFTDLNEGNYILFVKDQFDCIIQISFEITNNDVFGYSGLIPEFIYPKSNSIKVYDLENADDDNILKNRFNSSSCENKDDVVYKDIQRFRSWDILKLQAKSNYDDLRVYTDDFNIDLPLNKITNNLNLKQAMDCKVVDLGNSKSGIYFISGNLYNYDSLNVIEGNYSLNGKLPEWGKIGNVLTINAFNYVIVNIGKDSILKVEYLEINRIYDDEDLIVKSQYNILNYDVFEFFIVLKGRSEFNLDVFYDGKIQKRSELIKVDDKLDLSIIKSYSNYNTDMFFASGIKPMIRVLIDSGPKPIIKNSNEEYFTDEDSVQTDFENYEVDQYIFEPITKERARQLILFLSQSNSFIRGIKYRRDSIEIENLDRSNLAVVTADMVVKKQDKYKKDYELILSSSSRLSSSQFKNNSIIEV